MAAPRGIPHMGSPGQGQPPGMVPVGTPPYRNPAMPMTSQAAGNEQALLVLMDSSTNFKLLPKRHIFYDLVIRFITNRKYAFFCIF